MTDYRTGARRWQFGDGESPSTVHVASMTWRHGLFAHWPVDPGSIRPHVPRELTLDTYDGRAWVSVLPFVLVNAGLRGTPPVVRTAFPELNVRTYVRYRGDPGLFFFSIDVGSPSIAAAVGRATRLPVTASRMRVGAHEGRVVFASDRTAGPIGALGTRTDARTADDAPVRFSATYQPDGEAFRPEPGSLADWLVERRRFYAPANGDVLTGEVGHDRWPLRPATATIHENGMFAANGLPTPPSDPLVHYCDELAMTGSIPRRI